MRRLRTTLAVITCGLLGGSGFARADVVTDWNDYAMQAIATAQAAPPMPCRPGAPVPPAPRPGPVATIDLAMVHLAVHDAVQAIEGRYEPYGDPIWGASGSKIAAAAKAAHDVLINLLPLQTVCLDDRYHAYLATHGIPENDHGVEAGRRAAAGIIAKRAGDGRVLAHRSTARGSMFARTPAAGAEVDLSWLDASTLADVSADGALLVFSETMMGGRPNYGVYMRRTDGSPAVRLGDGRAFALSPNGKWVLATVSSGGNPRIVLLPTGAGDPREVPNQVVTDFRGGTFFPDSRRLVFSGQVSGQGPRLFVADVDGGAPRPIGPADMDVEFPVISPDGRAVAAANADGDVFVIPLPGGEPLPVPAVEPGELPIQWTADSRSLYVYRPDEIPARVYQVSVAGPARRLFREIGVADPTGLEGRMTVVMTPDGTAYAYSFLRWLSELYLVTGLR